MSTDAIPDTYRCLTCGFYKSVFPVRINAVRRIDENVRARALKSLRLANFRRILGHCASLLPEQAMILDVGCAHGWFMEVAKAQGYRAVGVEPDQDMAQVARAHGHNVAIGYFPDAISSDRTFDAISFNDVFEHLPSVGEIAEIIPSYLKPGGLLIVNLPVSNGMIFWLARTAAFVGIKGPLERMWQKGLPSPHQSYFSRSNLPTFLARYGFTLVVDAPLPSIELKGLYDRIRYDRSVNAIQGMTLHAASVVAWLASAFFPSDIRVLVFRRGSGSVQSGPLH
jgi:SAM-dependent methyltransferase